MLTTIDRPRKCRRFIVYDGEWGRRADGSLDLRMIGVYDGAEYRCYRSVDAFLDGELTHRNRGAWFYAHAGGLADIQFIVEKIYERCLRDMSWSLDAKFSGSAAIIAKIRHQRHLWLFLDSYWLFRDSLKSIGKSLGMPKGEPVPDPDEYGITDEEHKSRKRRLLYWYAHAPWEELRAYNEQDCRILWYAIDRFQSELMDMGGELQMTIASTGMNLFRRQYLSQNIDSHSYVNECAMAAYAASRVEKHDDRIDGEVDNYYYDINSSFPYAMTFPAPGNFLGSGWRLPEGYGEDDCKPFLADCEVEVPELDVPPLAYRFASRVFFPTGRWRNWFCNIDLAQLEREGGKIHKVHEVLRFDVFDDLRSYCLDVYGLRKATEDPFLRIVYKYLLNCLYGKFAEMMEKDTLLINPPQTPITAEEAEEMRMRQWLPGAWLQTVTRDVPHRIVPIATHITAIARRTLGHYLSVVRRRYYCDTDGFCTSERLHWPVVNDKGETEYHLAPCSVGNGKFVPLDSYKDLGGMKLEKLLLQGQSVGEFAGSKGYMLQGLDEKGKPLSLIKFKGMQRMTTNRYAELMEGKAIDMERMSRLRERLSKGYVTPAEATIRKRFNFVSPWSRAFDAKKHVVPKRFPYPDGQTRAWHIDELHEMLG